MLPRAKGARSQLYPEVDELMQRYTITAGNEPGNPEKGAERIIEVMTIDGELPERLVLGVGESLPQLNGADGRAVIASGFRHDQREA